MMGNGSAIGYAIAALKQLGYKEQDIKLVEAVMQTKMDQLSVEEAEEVYRKF